MDIRTARKIANNVGGNWSNQQRRDAFSRLDRSIMAWNDDDKPLAQNIWDWFGNLGVKGKSG